MSETTLIEPNVANLTPEQQTELATWEATEPADRYRLNLSPETNQFIRDRRLWENAQTDLRAQKALQNQTQQALTPQPTEAPVPLTDANVGEPMQLQTPAPAVDQAFQTWATETISELLGRLETLEEKAGVVFTAAEKPIASVADYAASAVREGFSPLSDGEYFQTQRTPLTEQHVVLDPNVSYVGNRR